MNVEQLDQELNAMIFSGKAMEAFEKFYAENVEMQENLEPPTVGKAANRQREIDFFSSVAEWHDGKVLSTAVNGDISFCEMEMEITLKGGPRFRSAQVAVRRWKGGQIVHERFYYSK
ncbi:MAG: SnoaL-like domain-containing protein [Bryobacteraceae bacterium]|nr:SnoaL-like domain-containing protein [Bryobacteraceae bacterium]